MQTDKERQILGMKARCASRNQKPLMIATTRRKTLDPLVDALKIVGVLSADLVGQTVRPGSAPRIAEEH